MGYLTVKNGGKPPSRTLQVLTLRKGAGMETYLTIEGAAEHLKLSAQTIRRYVLNREIPFHKIKKVIRFRLSEIEKWVDGGGLDGRAAPRPEVYSTDRNGAKGGSPLDDRDGDLFAEAEAGGTDGEGAAEVGEKTEAGGTAASEDETGGAA
jgi:excisionase family DNA binding protein